MNSIGKITEFKDYYRFIIEDPIIRHIIYSRGYNSIIIFKNFNSDYNSDIRFFTTLITVNDKYIEINLNEFINMLTDKVIYKNHSHIMQNLLDYINKIKDEQQ